MLDWSQFIFLRPQWLWLLAAIPILIWLFKKAQNASGEWQDVCDPALLPHVLYQGKQTVRSHSALPLLVLAWALLSTALAGPSWQRVDLPMFQQQLGRVIVLDASNSMLATDLAPSRLLQARLKLMDLINGFNEGQTGLIVFAGDAFVVAPLTDDKKTLLELLPSLQPDLMPIQGSRPDLAVIKAQQLLQQAGHLTGDIVLVTDTSATAKLKQSVRNASKAGFRVHVYAFATKQGAPIPFKGDFLKDSQGNTVVPVLDENLGSIARDGNGFFQIVKSNKSDTTRILSWLESSGDQDSNESERKTQQRQDQGFWLLLPLLLISSLLFRKGWLFILVLYIAPASEVQAQSFSWDDLWKTQNQQAWQALQDNQPDKALEIEPSSQFKAESNYRLTDFESAAEQYAEDASPDGQYNLGNALAKSGKLEEAIKAYEQAIKLNPAHEDAIFNKDLIEKMKQEQDKQEQQDQDQDGEEGEQDQQESDQEKQEQDQQSKDQQDSESQEESSEQEQQSESEQKSEEEKEAEEKEQQQSQEQKSEEEQQQEMQEAQLQDDLSKEEQQAMEQWLRRVPDDPGGLLRRKFMYQYRQRGKQQNNEKNW